MSCNRDERCRDIANYYRDLKENVLPSNFQMINESLEALCSEELNVEYLNIPNDYLGGKIKEKIADIITNFNSDRENFAVCREHVLDFVDAKIIEHQQHYDNYINPIINSDNTIASIKDGDESL